LITNKCLTGHVAALRCTSEEFQPWIIFQQDGAPPHWGSYVLRFLDAALPNRWIGRDGPTPWPPRSPDITPLDFFLWGYVKDKEINLDILNNVRREVSRQFRDKMKA